MARIQISNDPSGRIIVSFHYDPILVSKVKTIDGRRWHPAEKHWSFPNKNGILEKILKVSGDKEVQIDPALKTATSKVNPAPLIRCGVKDTPSPLVGEVMENREQPFFYINSENCPQRADNRVLEVSTQRLRLSQALNR